MAAVIPHFVDLPPAQFFPVVVIVVSAHTFSPSGAHLIKNEKFLQVKSNGEWGGSGQ
jgi:hypothetical protein